MSAPRKTKSSAASNKKPKPSRGPSPTSPDAMSAEVIEFITAIDDYKRRHQRPFPSWSEILDILKGLGYQRSA